MMKAALLFIVAYFLHCEGAAVVTGNVAVNERPIIGVLSQEQSFYLHTKYPEENYTSYIAASYVKDVEASGARVVPVMIGKDRSYYKDLMSKLNGVLFPGGATFFNQSDGYADAGQHIYEIAMEMNDAGNYFPIFGTCLGFELLIILASGRGEVENRIRCYSFENLPLNFTNGLSLELVIHSDLNPFVGKDRIELGYHFSHLCLDFRKSKMFVNAPEEVITILHNEDVTVNAHQFCIVDKNLEAYNLSNDWRVTSHSNDEYGVEFIATIEHTRYPFYGVQFHPEKIFEWKLSKNYVHSVSAIKANRYFMDFFVNECRRNFNTFESAAAENEYVIYNYEAHFTGVLGSMYHQCYLFEPRGPVVDNIVYYHEHEE